MRKRTVSQLIEILDTLYEAHDYVKVLIEKEEANSVIPLLEECQNTAVQIGNIIDNSEGEDTKSVRLLEEYCEVVYQVSIRYGADITGLKAKEMLDNSLHNVAYSIKNDIHVKQEVVFMPYKASMWDSLESVWKSANDDPDCDAYVVPIPYYDRNPDLSFGTFHYEGNLYPDYVPVVHYDNYDLAARRPDKIYIHNPYDDNNIVTTVDPRFYSSELKKYTDELIYIPYFVLEDKEVWDDAYLEAIEKFALAPAVMNADKVIVQSENMRKIYIRTLLKYCGDSREDLINYTEKIIGSGSPKFDKVINTKYDDIDIPEQWRLLIVKPNGGNKKIVLYNTSVVPFINSHEKMIEKIRAVLKIFYENKEEVVLLWRPHPLLKETIKRMHPELYDSYMKIVDKYLEEGWGIYDDTPDLNRAIALCDAYYGDMSSVVQLVQKVGKPIMIQNADVLD